MGSNKKENIDYFQKMIDSGKFIILGKMSASIAHEINNPVMIIQNLASLILDDIDNEGKIKCDPTSENYENLQIETNKMTCFFPFRETMKFSGFMKYFKNLRCLICNDPFGKFADISFGDAYFLTKKENGDGNTFLIVRNSEILRVLRNMERDNEVALFKDVKERDIKKSYKALFDRIKKIPKIIYTLKLIKKKTPINSPNLRESISLREVLSIIRNLIRINFGKYPFVWKRIFKKSGGNILFKEALFKKK